MVEKMNLKFETLWMDKGKKVTLLLSIW